MTTYDLVKLYVVIVTAILTAGGLLKMVDDSPATGIVLGMCMGLGALLWSTRNAGRDEANVGRDEDVVSV